MDHYNYWRYRSLRRRKISVVIFLTLLQCSNRMPDRRMWVHKWVAKRNDKGMHHNLFMELCLEDPNRFRRCLRMDSDTFEELVDKVTLLIQKRNTTLRESISPAERLLVTLRHLATGETPESLSLAFRLGQSTVSGIIRETCRALVSVLLEEHMRFPSSEAKWRVVSKEYRELWNFYQCIGTMDGKHCRIDPPLASGSIYYNCKDTFSIVLLAPVDAHLRFIYVDVGTNGRVSDCGIWNKCPLKQKLETNSIHVPGPSPLTGITQEFPYVVLGDEGFPLTEKVLIPYPGPQCSGRLDRRILNYRLSRARRCSENTFGVMGARFQIFRSPMRYDPDVATDIVLAPCCLHNFLRNKVFGRAMYTLRGMLDEENILSGTIRDGYGAEPARGMICLGHQGGNRHANPALLLRDRWCDYFNGVGAVPWQDRMVR